MSPRLLLTLSLLFFLPAACAPSPPSPASLPPPQVWVTPHPLSTPEAPDTPTSSPLPPSPFPSSLDALAFQTYGDRLIETITIPALGISSQVTAVGWHAQADAGATGGGAQASSAEVEWDSPGQAVGWLVTSALPDQPGNVILYGHNNMYASVFKNLGELSPGDDILLQTGQRTWEYHVSVVTVLPALDAEDEQPIYQAYLQATAAPRLTLLSCWPPTSNTHRVIVVAYPIQMP